MQEVKKKTYRNFTRSEKAIIRAYVTLMQKKNTDKITVTDIVNEADLNRSTFYAHFKSADSVREKIHSDIINELLGMTKKSDYKNSLQDPYRAMKHVLDFINKDEEMYKMLLNTSGADTFLHKLRDIVINQYMSDEIILPYINNREEFEMNLRLFIGGFVYVIKDWATGTINIPLERCTVIMSESIKNCVQYYTLKRKA